MRKTFVVLQMLSLPLTLQSDIFIVFILILGFIEIDNAANLLQYFRCTANRVSLCHFFFVFVYVSALKSCCYISSGFFVWGTRRWAQKNYDTDVYKMPREKRQGYIHDTKQHSTTHNAEHCVFRCKRKHIACCMFYCFLFLSNATATTH